MGKKMMDQDRFHALDTVRASALLLGFVLHGAMFFFMPISGMNSSSSFVLAASFYVIHIFRMSVFFFIAGFFAHLVFHRRGWTVFIKDRIRRIGIPLFIGIFTLVPATLALIQWGLSLSSWPKAFSGVLGSQLHGNINWSHLWFLYYLCIFYALVLVLYRIFDRAIDRTGRLRASIDRWTSLAMRSGFAPLLLAAPMCLWFFFGNGWVPFLGIPTPESIALNPGALTGYGTAFCFGWILHRQPQLLNECRKRWAVNLGIAIVLTAYCIPKVGLTTGLAMLMTQGSQMAPWPRFCYAAAYTMALWFWTFGIVGAAMRFCSAFSPRRRYLADASYWLYLMHLPVIMFLHVVMAGLSLHWTVKFPAILGISLALGLVSYRYFVRSTFVGSLLNGRRYPKNSESPTMPDGPTKGKTLHGYAHFSHSEEFVLPGGILPERK